MKIEAITPFFQKTYYADSCDDILNDFYEKYYADTTLPFDEHWNLTEGVFEVIINWRKE